MKTLKIATLLLSVLLLTSCASGYRTIEPSGLSYNSVKSENGVTLEYKYDLLDNKYAKKEQKNDVRLVAVKITNNSERDLVFGQDFKLSYESGNNLQLLDREKTFKELRQKPATYLFYLPLTLLTVQITTTNSDHNSAQTTNSIPVGLILGPGLAGGNLYQAARANKKLKKELLENDLTGKRIPKGETIYGLIGVRADNYDNLKINISEPEINTSPAEIVR